MQQLRHMMKHDFERMAFAGAFLVACGGALAVMGGLAALTNFCLTNQPLGLGNGFKLQAPYTAFATEVMRIQRSDVSTTTGAFSCGRFFRFDWFLWALQIVFLVIVGVAWYRRTIRKYQTALWSLGATVTAWHMYKINYICTMDYWTQGEVHTDGLITAGGLIGCCIGNYLMFFAGCAYAEREVPRGARVGGVDSQHPSITTTTKGGSFSEPPAGMV